MSETSVNPPSPNWQVEDYYLGHGEIQYYRVDGERIQYQAELGVMLEPKVGEQSLLGSTEGVADFITSHDDCMFSVLDSYEASDGKRYGPYLHVLGWKDLADEDRSIYESHKANNPSHSGNK
jgi:hypothetical protein